MSTHPEGRSWVEIRGAALVRNLDAIRRAAGPGTRLLPMVKADAYGLGMARTVEVLRGLEAPLAPWGFGVATVAEGVALREVEPDRPVWVCSPAAPGSEPDAVRAGLTLSVSSLEALDRLGDAARDFAGDRPGPVPFHLEVDTGMGRAGFPWRDAGTWLPEVTARLSGPGALAWEGVFTHFHSADEDPETVREQWGRLVSVVKGVPGAPNGPWVHACNSPAALGLGALGLPEVAAGAVRPGIFLYGGAAGPGLPSPDPVVSVRARVLRVQEVRPGDTLGYGATYTAAGAERWATLGIGYGDGLPRALSNRGRALVRGRSCPMVGRISMDVTVVDVTGVQGIREGDVATVIGADGGEEISLEEVAELAGTINYEILTGLSPRLPRVWL